MKKLNYLLFAIIVLLTSCQEKVTEIVTYKINEPIFMSADAFRNSVKVKSEPQKIVNYGKICFYQGFLYISESGKGIHIIDNRNPAAPAQVGFIEVLGNADLAIRNNLLYADSYIDLVWFDISNPAIPTLKGRLENVFSDALPTIVNNYGYDYNMCYADKSKGVIVGWELKERVEEITHYTGGWWNEGDGDLLLYDGTGAKGSLTTGVNGSMSRFALYNNYLYAVINNNLSVFNLSGAQPEKSAENLYIGRNVETIFSYKDNMFMGTPTGLLIYSVADPLKPEYQSVLSHVYGCDPVVVENDLAYVTVHSGNLCGQNTNELFVVDVNDVKNPKQIVAYTMTNPKGLAIDNGKLFLCDDGLKIYQLTNPQTLMSSQLAHYSGMDGFDVIAFDNVLMMIANDGLYQYDYSDLKNIKLLSKLDIGN